MTKKISSFRNLKVAALFCAAKAAIPCGISASNPLLLSVRHIGVYLSVSINTALHGEPSAPAKFSGAAFKK